MFCVPPDVIMQMALIYFTHRTFSQQSVVLGEIIYDLGNRKHKEKPL